MPPMHDDELPVDADLVRRLVRRSMPGLADLDVVPLGATGSSNALFRLGDELLVRLPRQPGGSAGIQKEARWAPVVAAGLSVQVPEVVALGEPALGYPETWAVTRWLDGEVPRVPWDVAVRGSSQDLALDLARLVAELRALELPTTDDPDLVEYRGGPLADVDDDLRAAVEECRGLDGLGLDLDHVLAVWDGALAAERASTPTRGWLHGDLVAENLLLRDGRLAALLDLGGLAVGDTSVDLVVAWEVLDAPGRRAFRRALDVDDATWAKGAGWALMIAMITFGYYGRTMPRRCADRRAMAAAVLADPPDPTTW